MYVAPTVVFAFHGCDETVANEVVSQNKNLNFSENQHDWLGHGIYFWQDDHNRALDWAKETSKRKNSKIKTPAVVGAIIHLGRCFDLLDIATAPLLRSYYDLLVDDIASSGGSMPKNQGKVDGGFFRTRDLDCAVIQRFHAFNESTIADELNIELTAKASKELIQKHPLYHDSVRGMFPEGEEVYPDAGFRAKNHIQICVRNPNCILAYFNPKEFNSKYKLFSQAL